MNNLATSMINGNRIIIKDLILTVKNQADEISKLKRLYDIAVDIIVDTNDLGITRQEAVEMIEKRAKE